MSLSRDHDPVTQVNPQTWFSGAFMEEIFLSPKQPDQFKKKERKCVPLLSEQRTERFFPQCGKPRLAVIVFSRPLHFEDFGQGTPGHQKCYSKRGEPVSPIEKHGTKYFPKRGSSKINGIVFTHVFGSLHLNVWSLSQTLSEKKDKKKKKKLHTGWNKDLCITKDRVNNSNGILHCELSLPS